jgi:argininosuccinate lyase
LKQQIDNGEFVIEAFEDVHSVLKANSPSVEVGKKIHTVRLRNDQVIALQLFYKEQLSTIEAQTHELFNTLLQLAETHT